jgi:tRNA threonylcarbamoyladenosine biosynthesis protein TsaE
MQKRIEYTLEQLDQVVVAVYEEITPGSIVILNGLLGAGKTTFIQKLCHLQGVKEPVVSPTYSYVTTYELPDVTIYHFDLYRISGIEEFESLGFYEYLNNVNSLICIEWPERIASLLMREAYADRIISLTFMYVMSDEKKREIRWIIRPAAISVNEMLCEE